MSDFFMPTQKNIYSVQNENENENRKRKSIFTSDSMLTTDEEFQQQKQQRLANRQRYGVTVPDQIYEVFNQMCARCSTPEEANELSYKLGSACRYMEMAGDTWDNFQNYFDDVDNLNAAQFPNLQDQKSRFEALSDSLQIGKNNVKLGELGQKLMKAHKENDIELADSLMAEINAINQQNVLLQDNVPRHFLMQELEAGAQSLPFSGAAAVAGVFGNFIAPGAGTAASFAVSSYLAAGSEYVDMIANGSTPETARTMALITGGIEGIIEANLGITKGIVKGSARLMGKEVAESFAQKKLKEIESKVLKNVHFGTFKRNVINYLERRGGDILGEGMEEFWQENASILGKEIAAALDGYDIPDDDIKSIVKQTTQAFKGGVLGALGLGLLPGMNPARLEAYADFANTKFVRDAAEAIDSEEVFKNTVKDNPIFKDMPKEQKDNDLHEIWQNAQQRKEERTDLEARKIAEGLDAGEGAEGRKVTVDENGNEIEQQADPVARNEAGRLITKDEVNTDENGNVTGGTFRVGDTSKSKEEGNRYGYIKYSTAENGDITIEDFKMNSQRQGLRAEVFEEFAREHPDVNIEWNAIGSEWQDVKQELIKNNPSGAKNGLRYFTTADIDDIATRKSLFSEIRENVHNYKPVKYFDENNQAKIRYEQSELTNEQLATAVEVIELRAKHVGLSITDYMNKRFKDGKLFGNPADIAKSALAQKQNPDTINGGIKPGKARENWQKDGMYIKGVIYAAQNADFATLIHELSHGFRAELTGQELADAEAAFDVKDGDWDALSKYKGPDGEFLTKEEAFAYFGQDYFITGKAPTPQMENIFKRLAKYLAEALSRLSKHLEFSPEIAKVFNNLLANDDSVYNKALKAAQEEEGEYRAKLKREAEAKEAQKKAESEEAKRQAEAEREEASEGTDFSNEEAEQSTEEIEKKLDEVTNEKEPEGNAIDDALKDLPLTDDKKAEIAETLKDESSTVVEKAEAATEAASSVYDVDDEDLENANKLYISRAVTINNELINETGDKLRILARNVYDKLEDAHTVDGKTVEFTTPGRKKIVYHSADETVLKCTPQLKELLEKAIFLFTEPPSHYTKKDTIMFYNYGVKINFDGEDQLLRLSVRETPTHEFFYDAHNSKIEDIKKGLLSNSIDRQAKPAEVDKSLTKDKLYQWLKSVKQKYQDDMLFQIVGEIGAENLDNSEIQEGVTRMQNLAIAKQMETDGKDAQAIRLATGWEKGADGKWRWEIDDSKIKTDFEDKALLFRKKNPRYGELEEKLKSLNYDWEKLSKEEQEEFDKLGDLYSENYGRNEVVLMDILDAPELFRAYPIFKEMPVKFKPRDYSENYEAQLGSGHYEDTGEPYFEINFNGTPNSYNSEKFKSTLLHEIQHAIQHLEGFAQGGSPESAADYIEKENQKKAEIKNKAFAWEWKLELEKQEEKHPELKGNLALMNSLIDEYTENGKYSIKELEDEHWLPERDIRDKGFNLYVRGYDKAGFEDAYKEWQETASKKGVRSFEPTEATDRNKFEYYKRFAGETESRNVQTRINFTPEERREALLAATEDVDRDDQIMLFQTVYHGSGADFDKFDTENFGLSGEGSMSFGYGTYVTDDEEIARDYAERQRPYRKETLLYKGRKPETDTEKFISGLIEQADGIYNTVDELKNYLEGLIKTEENAEKIDPDYVSSTLDTLKSAYELISSKDFDIKDVTWENEPKTDLYTVEIPDDGYILWNEPVTQEMLDRITPVYAEEMYNRWLNDSESQDGFIVYNDMQKKGIRKSFEDELQRELDADPTYDGAQLYKHIQRKLEYYDKENGARLTSKLLNKAGYAGIKYPAGTIHGNGNGAYNYVIFNDDDAQIVDKLLFQTQAELMDEARSFETWQEFMAYCEVGNYEGNVFENDEAWYKSFWEQANAITQEEEKQFEAEERQQEAEADTPEMVDRLFISFIKNNPDAVDNFVQEVAEIAGLDLAGDEWAQVDEEGGRERERYSVLQDYINAELSDGNWQTAIAKVQGGHELSDYIRKRLVAEMTDSYKARDFRNLYSAIMKDKRFTVDALETRAAEIERKLEKYAKRYYDIVAPTEDVTVTTPQRRKQIAQEMQNRDMAVRIKAGSLKVDDEVYNYLKSVEKKEKDLKKQEQQLTDKIQGLYQDVGNTGLQMLINTHEKLMEQKARLNNRNADTQRKIDKGLRMTDRYTRQTQEMTQTYHELERKFSDLKDSMIITDEVQKILDAQEQRREIREEVARLTKERYLADETKKIRVNLVKQLFRKVPLDKVDFKQAQLIIAIQKLTMPNMIGGVNRWIGRNSPFLNAVLSRIVTDSEYKERIVNYLEHVEKQTDTFHDFVESIRNAKSREDFENWGVAEREYAIKYLPKENWVWELKLKEKARELQESLQIDITQEKIERQVYDADGHPVEDDEGKPVTETAYQFKIGDEALNKLLQETLGDELFNRLMNSPMVEWSTQEMEELVARVNQIRDEGITMRAAKLEARKREAQKFMQQIEQAVKNTGITINEDDTPEEKEKKIEKINKILGKNKNLKGTEASKDNSFTAKLNRILHGYKDANVLRVARILDNQSEGINTYLLYRKEDDCYNAKMRSMVNRGETVHAVMATNKINEGELAKNITIEELGTKVTVDELLFFLAADKDYQLDENGNNDNYAATSRNAVMFGNMMSDSASQELKEGWAKLDAQMKEAIEKDLLTPEQRQLLSDKQLDTKPGTTAYIRECNRRWNIMIKAANDFLSTHPEYNALLEAIQADYADQYERMNEVSINEFNVGVNRVKCYVPLVRREQNGETNENQVMEDLLAINGVGKSGVNKGMTQSRTSISPLHQRPVQTGLFRTWCDSVERTEHFIAYAPYVRLLNRVYNGRDSQYLRSTIEGRYGKGMLDYIDAYINEVANPNAGNTRSIGAELLHILRGKTAPAYLGWKASAIIKQGLTSPWPYMQFINPAEYLAACFKCNNPKMWEAIQEKSVFMKNRRMDPINDLVDEMSKNAKNKADKLWSSFTKIGMQGLEWIDWACVAPGWYACYEKKYNQLQKASESRYNAKMAELEERNRSGSGEPLNPTQMETIARQEISEDIEVEAVTYADDCTRQCQPSNRATDLAPLFKEKNEFLRAFLQFQTSLNVIWQNLRYDMPYAVKNKEFTRIAGTVIGYVMAGIFMNSVMEGIGGDDDDDEKQALRNLIYYSTTQFTDAVPILGSEITNVMDKVITGKRAYAQSGTDMTPSATKLLSALQNTTSGNWKKAAELTAEGIGLYLGAPVSGTKEIYKLLGKPFSEGDVNFKRGISDVYGLAGDILEE